MMGFNRGSRWAMAVWALCLAGQAGAQENLDFGKTGAQLFASDCAGCHKSAASLAKAGGVFGLSNFLREHYTASNQSAAAIAAYLESFGRTQGKRPAATKRTAKGDEKAKAGGKKPGTASSGEAESGKPAEARTSEPRPPAPIPSQPKADAAPAAKPKSD